MKLKSDDDDDDDDDGGDKMLLLMFYSFENMAVKFSVLHLFLILC